MKPKKAAISFKKGEKVKAKRSVFCNAKILRVFKKSCKVEFNDGTVSNVKMSDMKASADTKTASIPLREINLINLSQSDVWQPRVMIKKCAVPSNFSGNCIAKKALATSKFLVSKSQEEVTNKEVSCTCSQRIKEKREKIRQLEAEIDEEIKFQSWWAAEKFFFRRQQLNQLEKQRQQEIQEREKARNAIKEKEAQRQIIVRRNKEIKETLERAERMISRLEVDERLQAKNNSNEKYF